jgi:hypothetical protein
MRRRLLASNLPSLGKRSVDFLKIIRSIEEFLYEAMTWLLFYPRTLWRCVRHPDWIIAYTDKELGESPGEQFTDLISPPLFLIISIVVAHGVELSLGNRLQPSNSRLVNEIAASEQNLLVFRALIFSVFPLVMAAGLLHTRGTPIDRATLRSPFFLQCYLAAPFAVVTSSAVALLRAHGPTYHVIGGVLLTLALVWFVVVQTRWLYKQTGQGWGRAFGLALGYLLLALLLVALIGAAVVTA